MGTFQELKEKAEEKSEVAKIAGILNGIKRPPFRTIRWTNRVIAITSTKNTPEDSKIHLPIAKTPRGLSMTAWGKALGVIAVRNEPCRGGPSFELSRPFRAWTTESIEP